MVLALSVITSLYGLGPDFEALMGGVPPGGGVGFGLVAGTGCLGSGFRCA